ncbi:MAG: hypothetical protein WDN02_06540 [Methylovirgula sp.]|uniref:hypothetical protein n=1 Tax=Methylovirgula sp. TaxID=1978224 RepID=UPI003075FA5F
MRLLISMLLGVSLSAAIMAPAFSEPLALASCAKFTSARDEKASLFAGYIYGFVAARMGYKDEKRLTAAAVKVRADALKICQKTSDASFAKIIDALTADLAKRSWLQKL